MRVGIHLHLTKIIIFHLLDRSSLSQFALSSGSIMHLFGIMTVWALMRFLDTLAIDWFLDILILGVLVVFIAEKKRKGASLLYTRSADTRSTIGVYFISTGRSAFLDTFFVITVENGQGVILKIVHQLAIFAEFSWELKLWEQLLLIKLMHHGLIVHNLFNLFLQSITCVFFSVIICIRMLLLSFCRHLLVIWIILSDSHRYCYHRFFFFIIIVCLDLVCNLTSSLLRLVIWWLLVHCRSRRIVGKVGEILHCRVARDGGIDVRHNYGVRTVLGSSGVIEQPWLCNIDGVIGRILFVRHLRKRLGFFTWASSSHIDVGSWSLKGDLLIWSSISHLDAGRPNLSY